MAVGSRTYRRRKLTFAAKYLAELLEENTKPVVDPLEFFRITRRMYREGAGKRLFLRPHTSSYHARLQFNLKKARVIRPDQDYERRGLRVLAIPDLPAENITCLMDPTCYVSHLSAMQRWGLTNRNPDALMLTRPDNKTASVRLRARTEALAEGDSIPSKLKAILHRRTRHPPRVRNRAVRVHESTLAGASLEIRGDSVRLSTIGQTFLDMLQEPNLCGGMSHILDVWEEHAQTYLDEIVAAVDTATRGIVKIRAGHILEERQGLWHRRVEAWRAFCQRGGSRKLDPTRDYAPTYSEKWLISLNV